MHRMDWERPATPCSILFILPSCLSFRFLGLQFVQRQLGMRDDGDDEKHAKFFWFPSDGVNSFRKAGNGMNSVLRGACLDNWTSVLLPMGRTVCSRANVWLWRSSRRARISPAAKMANSGEKFAVARRVGKFRAVGGASFSRSVCQNTGQTGLVSRPIRQRQAEIENLKNFDRRHFFSRDNYPPKRPFKARYSVAEVCSKNGQTRSGHVGHAPGAHVSQHNAADSCSGPAVATLALC